MEARPAAIQALDGSPGERILISGLEHNAASPPVRLVAERHGVGFAAAPYAPGNPMDLDWVEELEAAVPRRQLAPAAGPAKKVRAVARKPARSGGRPRRPASRPGRRGGRRR